MILAETSLREAEADGIGTLVAASAFGLRLCCCSHRVPRRPVFLFFRRIRQDKECHILHVFGEVSLQL